MTLDCALAWPSYKQETLRRPQNKERGTALPWGLFLAGWAFLFAVTLFVICMEAADALGRLDGEENLLPPPPHCWKTQWLCLHPAFLSSASQTPSLVPEAVLST